MKSKICKLLVLALVLSLLGTLPARVRATEETADPTESTSETTQPTEETTDPEPEPDPDAPMVVSQELLDMLKTMEGFYAQPYWDYKQWTIGYGTRCPDDMVEYYKKNPITEEKAQEMLMAELVEYEVPVNNFIKKHGLKLKQHQYDALISFSYNCGTGWTTSTSGYFTKAVLSGDVSNQFIYAMLLWSKAGSDYILIPRRKSEVNLYINGIYKAYNVAGGVPADIKHVFLDGNGGTVHYIPHGYDAKNPAGIVTDFTQYPTGKDAQGKTFTYTFAGWFTQPVGGRQVTVLDGTLDNGVVLYAQWKDPQGEIVSLPKGTPVDNIKVTVTGTVNIRSGPGTYYPVLTQAKLDEKLVITETFLVGETLWGKCEKGWLSLNYTDYKDVINPSTPDAPASRWGTVTTQSGGTVNIRTGPGTSYAVKYAVKTGDRVEIFETASDGTRMWGKLSDGNWICMDYVVLDVVLQSVTMQSNPKKTQYVQMQDALDLTGAKIKVTYTDGTTKTLNVTADMVTGFSNATLGSVKVTVKYKEKTTTFTVTVIKATVVFKNYDGTVLSSQQYAYGENITPPTATRPATATHRYEFTGWDKPVANCNGDAVYTAQYKAVQRRWGTVKTEGSNLNIRTGPGSDYDKNGDLPNGTRVEILDIATESGGSRQWGKIDENKWICLDYVVMEEVKAPSGDVNGDGTVNDRDALYLLRYTLMPTNYPIAAGVHLDFNGDGSVNDRDALYLLRYTLMPEQYPLHGA